MIEKKLSADERETRESLEELHDLKNHIIKLSDELYSSQEIAVMTVSHEIKKELASLESSVEIVDTKKHLTYAAKKAHEILGKSSDKTVQTEAKTVLSLIADTNRKIAHTQAETIVLAATDYYKSSWIKSILSS